MDRGWSDAKQTFLQMDTSEFKQTLAHYFQQYQAIGTMKQKWHNLNHILDLKRKVEKKEYLRSAMFYSVHKHFKPSMKERKSKPIPQREKFWNA